MKIWNIELYSTFRGPSVERGSTLIGKQIAKSVKIDECLCYKILSVEGKFVSRCLDTICAWSSMLGHR